MSVNLIQPAANNHPIGVPAQGVHEAEVNVAAQREASVKEDPFLY